jgi:8-oxo-dGTP diphosphatase
MGVTLLAVKLGDDWRYCPRCAAALQQRERHGALRPTCPVCGFVFYAAMGVGVAAVIQDAGGRVLLVQRAAGYYGAGLWCIPCGYVEWGEDLRAAAAREVLEEAGVEADIAEVVHVAVNRHEPERPTVGVWFGARLRDPDAQPCAGDDACAVGWFDPATPPPLAFPTDAPVLAKLASAR